jgi:proteasome lid subunit RPN8/RPN11
VPAVLDEIASHARAALPDECCGLLVGTTAGIVEAVRSINLADDPTRRFLIDPATHFETRRRAAERGLEVVGFYHSHPRSEPVPSATDLAGASYPEHWYLIVKPLAAGCEARMFRLDAEGFVEVDVETS